MQGSQVGGHGTFAEVGVIVVGAATAPTGGAGTIVPGVTGA